jgi:formate hydrogenlyase subunit 4
LNSLAEAVGLSVAQMSVVIATAPLVNGVIKRVKARFQMRMGPPLLQGYFDIAKWLARSERKANTSSFVSTLAPPLIIAAVLSTLVFLPVFRDQAPSASGGDLLVVVGLLALCRALLSLAGMDTGGAFGGMGSSRELAVGALIEPVLLLALVTLAIQPGTTRLDEIMTFGIGEPGLFLNVGWVLAAAAFLIAILAETGRIPFDNPDTHLELTMIHEGMLIEYSGRSLGLLHLAGVVKQLVLILIFVNVFLPFGMASLDGIAGFALGAGLVTLKVVAIAVVLGVVESLFAKMRLFQLPDLIGTAGFSATLGVAMTVLFA